MRTEQVAAFVDHRLGAAERSVVESHLADCAECRSEVIEVDRLISNIRRRRAGAVVGGGLAIAASAILVVSVMSHRRPGTPDDMLRGTTADSLVAVSPKGSVARAGLAMVWHRAEGNASYRVSITDATGRIVWSSDTRNTSVAVPDSIQLLPGHEYLWTADAILAQGISRSTSLQSFRIAP